MDNPSLYDVDASLQRSRTKGQGQRHLNIPELRLQMNLTRQLLLNDQPPLAYRIFPRHRLQQQQQGNDDTNKTSYHYFNYSWCVPGGDRIDRTLNNNNNILREEKPPVPVVKGLLFAKTIKTASSTAAAVTMRLARRVAQRQGRNHQRTAATTGLEFTAAAAAAVSPCSHMFLHAQSYANLFAHRDVTASFLWTILRKPDKRAISAFKYFQMGILGHQHQQQQQSHPNAASLPHDTFIAYLEATKDQMLQQLRMDRPRINEAIGILTVKKQSDKNKAMTTGKAREMMGKVRLEQAGKNNGHVAIAKLIRDTVQRYNFIAISERMEESLVVLLVLLGLIDTKKPMTTQDLTDDNHHHLFLEEEIDSILADVIVLASKQAGGYEENAWAAKAELRTALLHQGLPTLLTTNVSISNRGCIVIPKHLPFELNHPEKLQQSLSMDDHKNDSHDSETNSKISSISVAAVSETTNMMLQFYLEHNYTMDNLDYLLYDFANRNLDHTIDTVIGRRQVEQLVQRLRTLQHKAITECSQSAIFPCSSTGHRQSRSKSDCYAADMGCGYRCIDQLFPIILSE
ncbi:hypothetical protein ACA910_001756 [Epithemia clementina (nom. ined.)]